MEHSSALGIAVFVYYGYDEINIHILRQDKKNLNIMFFLCPFGHLPPL